MATPNVFERIAHLAILVPVGLAAVACGATHGQVSPRDTSTAINESVPKSEMANKALELEQLCAAGNAESCYDVGILLEQGQGMPHDPVRAKAMFQKACKGHEAQACLNIYTDGCKGGDGLSCYELAKIYEQGLGVNADLERASDLFVEACTRHHNDACRRSIDLALVYAKGDGVKQDGRRASAMLTKVCVAGNALGCFKAGELFERGEWGGEPDRLEASRWYSKGCDGNDFQACVDFGVMVLDGSTGKKDPLRAAVIFTKSCDGGNNTGCWLLGDLFMRGRGVSKDSARGMALFVKACDGGEALACHDLGVLYDLGQGNELKADLVRAAAYYAKACDNLVADSCFALGNLYNEGRGVPKNERQAKVLFETACTHKQWAGCFNLGNSYMLGRGVSKDGKAAAHYFAIACEGGLGAACFALGDVFSKFADFAGVSPEPKIAQMAFTRACKLGETKACARVQP